ncbi:hypothetical protein F5Y17DRAFT_10554 [Xylariaceae sp. FL0594]|nr:hypothetical protein F5Y17DRAFT_10554 [Xylariaceae sp. FL0594]
MAVRPGDAWFLAGLLSSFPNITESGSAVLCDSRASGNGDSVPGCKVFQAPSTDSTEARQIQGDEMTSYNGVALRDQVLVFRYRDKVHAVDNKCPHSAYPLVNGTPFDIEDFGVVLSAGISCPKHGWSFDLFTGTADRNNYQLQRWEVQLRPVDENHITEAMKDGLPDQEVWIRRKQRMG